MHACVFEDNHTKNFLPLVYFRPLYDLRCGAVSLRERLELLLPKGSIALHVRPGFAGYLAEQYPDRPINAFDGQDTLFVNGRLLPGPDFVALIRQKSPGERVFMIGDEVAAAFFHEKTSHRFAEALFDAAGPVSSIGSLPAEQISGTLLRYPWEIIDRTPEEIEKDFRTLKRRRTGSTILARLHPGVHLLNKRDIAIGRGSIVKPGAVLDAESGPVIIGRDVTVMANAVIQGPAFIGDHSLIKAGANIYSGTSIGVHCKIGGEVECSVIQSYSNKQHGGYLGHSYLGSWVNLGAATNTSDLKNTYGTVRVSVNGAMVDTGRQFVGLTMGDHSKSGINAMFDTGTVVGVSCNIFGAGLPPKSIPSFVWGGDGKFSTYELEKSLDTARRVMARRDVALTREYEKLFREVCLKTEPERRSAGIVA